jgi:hypothetical protein
MAKYYYNKYTVNSSSYSYYYESGGWVSAGTASTDINSTAPSGYYFSSSDGYHTSGSTLISSGLAYVGGGTIVDRYIPYDSDSTYIYVSIDRMTCTLATGYNYSQGSLVASNIIAEDGTYPANGQSGGYWYVRQGLAPSFFFMNF